MDMGRQLGEAIATVYEAGLGSTSWEALLECIRGPLGVGQVGLLGVRLPGGCVNGTVPPAAVRAWTPAAPRAVRLDVLLPQILARHAPAESGIGDTCTAPLALPDTGATPPPMNAASVLRDGTLVALLLSSPDGGAKAFEDGERRFVERLLPHLARAVDLRCASAQAASRLRGFESACERLAFGLLQVDASSRVLWANAAGRAALEDGLQLGVSDGRLVAARAEDTRRLRNVVHVAAAPCGTRARVEKRRFRPLVLRREARASPLFVFVLTASAPAGGVLSGADTGIATLFLVEPRHSPRISPVLLRQLYPFTPAEARLASRLLGGRSIEELAAETGVTRQTVRQHLKQIFHKTDTHRQAELLAVLASAVGWVRN